MTRPREQDRSVWTTRAHHIVCSSLVYSLLFSVSAFAATYYMATNGSGANPGSEAQPFGTLQHAANVADTPGDTVHVRGGRYHSWAPHNHGNVTHSGASGNPITFTNYPGAKTGHSRWRDSDVSSQ